MILHFISFLFYFPFPPLINYLPIPFWVKTRIVGILSIWIRFFAIPYVVVAIFLVQVWPVHRFITIKEQQGQQNVVLQINKNFNNFACFHSTCLLNLFARVCECVCAILIQSFWTAINCSYLSRVPSLFVTVSKQLSYFRPGLLVNELHMAEGLWRVAMEVKRQWLK